MVLYHRGAAIQPSVTKEGTAFVARAVILEEDGEATLDAAKGQKTGIGCDRGRTHKSAFSPPFNGGFAPPLPPATRQRNLTESRTPRPLT
jgi:hypothetical protein